MAISELDERLQQSAPPELVVVPQRADRHREAAARTRPKFPFLTIGILLLAFLVFEFTASSLMNTQAQRRLTRDLAGATLAAVPPVGTPIGSLVIPALGINDVIIEGTSATQTAQGPGHLVNTPLPGQPGNTVILGRRTTWGAPFDELDTLAAGDQIGISTAQGDFTYEATQVSYVLNEGPDILTTAAAENQLTLVTSDPAYLPQHRLVVTATLTSPPVAASAGRPLGVGSPQLGLASDLGALPMALLSGALLVGLLAAVRRLYRAWSPRVTWLLTTPTLIALLIIFFVHLDRLVPSTL